MALRLINPGNLCFIHTSFLAFCWGVLHLRHGKWSDLGGVHLGRPPGTLSSPWLKSWSPLILQVWRLRFMNLSRLLELSIKVTTNKGTYKELEERPKAGGCSTTARSWAASHRTPSRGQQTGLACG